jgi:hypothetical protein
MFWGSHHPILMATFGEKMELTLKLTVDEVNAILQTLGDLPSKTGAWPLIVKVKQQADAQMPKPEAPAAE